MIILLIYLSGVVFSWGYCMKTWNEARIPRELNNPEEGYKAFPTLYKNHFDEYWKKCLRKRRFDLIFTIILCSVSWYNVFLCWISYRVPLGFNWWFRKLPDKEEFRKNMMTPKPEDKLIDSIMKCLPGAN